MHTASLDAKRDGVLAATKNSRVCRFPQLVAASKHGFREILIALVIIFPIAFVAGNYLEDLVEGAGPEGFGQFTALVTELPTRLINVTSNAGYPGVFFLMLLDSAGFPFPSEIILPFAGYLVFKGTLQYWPVVFYGTVAALLGSFAEYYVGRKLGTPLITGQVRLPVVPIEQLQRAQTWFDAHGPAAVALLRLVPAARGLISFPAGACRMKPVTFEVCTLAGCLIWNICLVYLGWWLGSSWGVVASLSRYASLFVYPVMAVFVFWLVSRRSEHRNASKLSKNDSCDPS